MSHNLCDIKYRLSQFRFNIEMKLKDEFKHCLLCLDVLDEVGDPKVRIQMSTQWIKCP